MVILTLWDFLLKDVPNRLDLIRDVNKLNSYTLNALIPMIEGVEHNTNLIAWEIMNEPEWIVHNNFLVSWKELQ